ncbi:NADPH dependent diflavin oxidoreductase-like protein 1 [Viridothelium virens]|uniref:NADPH-dependent diflavin oxidoreductase 1 n=1 Tax=Viridothelium virens TaxID=1048519 RepID=A0A6A6H4A2_VIRVR|nr:NADPH dependent diflavin oxidoreductase-like protein 1 [Viridothelium virens]
MVLDGSWMDPCRAGPLPGRTALVCYGSETGNAQEAAEELARIAERLRFSTRICDLNSTPIRDLPKHDFLAVAISTTGQGDLPANARSFWANLRSTRLRPGVLRALRFASFGLGDSSYPKFNFAHRKLYNRLAQLGAQPILAKGEADEQDPEGLENSFLPWAQSFRDALLKLYPLPLGTSPVPEKVFLEPQWFLRQATGVPGITSNGEPEPKSNGADRTELEELPLPMPGSIIARVESNTRVTPETHEQDVRHLVFSFAEHIPYGPGDVLTINPKNFAEDVNEFISLMRWSTVADEPLLFEPSGSLVDKAYQRPVIAAILEEYPKLTLRSLLTNHLDIMSIPRRSFFVMMAHFTNDSDQKERLLEFADPQNLQDLYDYTTRPRRSILEVLQEFHTVKLPWKWAATLLPTIHGRQFSIASGGNLKTLSHGGTRIELLVAVVKYRTVIKRVRQGVCTRYLASLNAGQRLSVTIERGGLHITRAEAEKPVIMIGPGTGVAPMRSLILERDVWAEDQIQGKVAQDILFYGSRNEKADYFFRDEWKRLHDAGRLDVYTAFSRDQRQKIYVQDRIKEEATRVFELLYTRGGLVYVSGSSGNMPKAVRAALAKAIETGGDINPAEAEAYIVQMEQTGRYKQETW